MGSWADLLKRPIDRRQFLSAGAAGAAKAAAAAAAPAAEQPPAVDPETQAAALAHYRTEITNALQGFHTLSKRYCKLVMDQMYEQKCLTNPDPDSLTPTVNTSIQGFDDSRRSISEAVRIYNEKSGKPPLSWGELLQEAHEFGNEKDAMLKAVGGDRQAVTQESLQHLTTEYHRIFPPDVILGIAEALDQIKPTVQEVIGTLESKGMDNFQAVSIVQSALNLQYATLPIFTKKDFLPALEAANSAIMNSNLLETCAELIRNRRMFDLSLDRAAMGRATGIYGQGPMGGGAGGFFTSSTPPVVISAAKPTAPAGIEQVPQPRLEGPRVTLLLGGNQLEAERKIAALNDLLPDAHFSIENARNVAPQLRGDADLQTAVQHYMEPEQWTLEVSAEQHRQLLAKPAVFSALFPNDAVLRSR